MLNNQSLTLALLYIRQFGSPLVDASGLAQPVHDDPGCSILGCGYRTGANALLNLLSYNLEDSWRFDPYTLVSFVIDRVEEIDPMETWRAYISYFECK